MTYVSLLTTSSKPDNLEVLHILNGDATLGVFPADLPGRRIVWREVLCEGPVSAPVATEPFWAERAAYFQSLGWTGPDGYRTATVGHFQEIHPLGRFSEVILWFEYDLFCQFNLLGLLSFLKRAAPAELAISLVSADKGLGELSSSDYPELFEKRIALTPEASALGARCWEVYTRPDHAPLRELARDCGSFFPHLATAVDLHFQRFPGDPDGLTGPERVLLAPLQEQARTHRQLIGSALRRDPGYGYGDWQWEVYLGGLGPLLTSNGDDDLLQLNELGWAVAEGKEDFRRHGRPHYQYGGATTRRQ